MRFSFLKAGIIGIALSIPAGLYAGSMFWTTPDPTLPPHDPRVPGNTVYLTGPGTHAIYGSPDGTIDLLNVMHKPMFPGSTHTIVGMNEMDTFSSMLLASVSIGGGAPMEVELMGDVTTTEVDEAGHTTGTFNTIMDSMDLTGTLDGHSIEIMLDPARPTTGQVSIMQVSPGLYHINSFFDVFTELSIDHHPFSPQIGGPSVVTLTCIPEPQSLGMIALGFGALIGAVRARRRDSR
jgi:hypothetical protein